MIPSQRDAVGVTIEGNFRFRELPAPPRGQEVSAEGLREAQRITALTFRADLSESGRMRLELVGAAFPLPPHTEIRARADLLGHLLFWPDLTAYRVVPPGRCDATRRRADSRYASNVAWCSHAGRRAARGPPNS